MSEQREWTEDEIAEYRSILEAAFQGRAAVNPQYLIREGLFALGQIERLQARLAAADALAEAARQGAEHITKLAEYLGYDELDDEAQYLRDALADYGAQKGGA